MKRDGAPQNDAPIRPVGAGFSWNDMGVTKTDLLTSCVVSAEKHPRANVRVANSAGRVRFYAYVLAGCFAGEFSIETFPKVVFCWSFHSSWFRFCPDGVLAWEILQEITATCWDLPSWIPKVLHQRHLYSTRRTPTAPALRLQVKSQE